MLQEEMKPYTVRVKFAKVGSLKFISHLDLQRTFMKIIIRSGIPIWYTEGFNPHPRLVFATPMSVGCESVCEYLDFKLNAECACDDVRVRLAENSPPELEIKEVYLPELKFSDIAFSEYRISLKYPCCAAGSADLARAALAKKPLNLMKRTKSGEKETDISPFIRSVSVSYSEGELALDCVLSSGSENFLNPDYIITAVGAALGEDFKNDLYSSSSVIRMHDYLSDGVTEFR